MNNILFKILMLKGDAGEPTDEQTQSAVDDYMQAHPEAAIDETIINSAVGDWLDEHPEATTTVQDGSLTEAKFSNALKLKAIKDYVTPEMYGAKGDGATDDTDAIQSAFDSGFPVLFTNAKTYIVASSLVIPSNIVIDLNGCTIKKKSGLDFHLIIIDDEENILIRNGELNGNGDNISGSVNGRLILANRVNNLTLYRCNFSDNKNWGVNINASDHITVENCKFINSNPTGWNNNLQFYLNYGVDNTARPTNNIRIIGNYFENIEGDNVVIGGINQNDLAYIGENCLIDGNVFVNPCPSASAQTTGVMGAIVIESGTSHNNVGYENIVISNNSIHSQVNSTSLHGIILTTSKNVVCCNNVINGCFTGILVDETNDARIIDNSINNTITYAIRVNSVSEIVAIQGNKIENIGNYGICIFANEHIAKYRNYLCLIIGNSVTINEAVFDKPIYEAISVRDRLSGISTPVSAHTGDHIIKANGVYNNAGVSLANGAYYFVCRDTDESGIPFVTIRTGKDNFGYVNYAKGVGVIPANSDTAIIDISLKEDIGCVLATPISSDIISIRYLDSNTTRVRFRCSDIVASERQFYYLIEGKYTI